VEGFLEMALFRLPSAREAALAAQGQQTQRTLVLAGLGHHFSLIRKKILTLQARLGQVSSAQA
jgi:hypothetical protein